MDWAVSFPEGWAYTCLMREPYILFRRSDGGQDGRTYYVSFWDQDRGDYVGKRSVGRLLADLPAEVVASPTSKAGARAIVDEWLKTHTPGHKRSELAIDYLDAFWASEGAYAKGKLARGKGLSEQYLYNNRNWIKKYVRPYLEDQGKPILLSRLSAGILEGFAMHLFELDISTKTANQILAAVGKPLEEATRLGLIPHNPMRRVEKLAEEDYVREILSVEEVRAFFALPWSDPRLYAINLLAATTGMRLGECRGLLSEDIRGGEIYLTHNWQDREKQKGPKGSRGAIVKARRIPLPQSTQKALSELAKKNPWGDGFVFFGDSKGRPIGKQVVETAYNEGLEAIKIDETSRKARGLGFHAWRHWFNSQLRGKVDDHSLRLLTGHSSHEMTEHYTEVTTEQRIAVARLAENLT